MTGIAAPEEIVEVIKPVFDGLDREQFVVLYLNMKLHPIGVEIIAIGGSYECNVEIKNVFKGAIVANAVAIAVAHNHPSGVPKPSDGDFYINTPDCMGRGNIRNLLNGSCNHR